jgi:rhamnulose-1-phosphate aldolase
VLDLAFYQTFGSSSRAPAARLAMRLPLQTGTLDAIARCAARVAELGWAEAGAGNLSLLLAPAQLARSLHDGDLFEPGLPADFPCRLPAGHLLVTSAAGSPMRAIATDPAAHLALIGDGPRGLFRLRGTPPPTSELACHLAVHAQRGAPGALLHAHTDFLIALSLLPRLAGEGALEAALLGLMPETAALLPGGLARLRLALPGSAALARASAEAIVGGGASALIWERHGALALGATLDEALARLEVLEKTARIWWLAHRTGEDPAGLALPGIEFN